MLRDLNVLALVVVVVCGVLVGLGKVEAESFLLLVTGLAIPAKSTGYQDTGAAPITAVPIPPQDGPGDR